MPRSQDAPAASIAPDPFQAAAEQPIDLSVVVPIFNEEAVLPLLIHRLRQLADDPRIGSLQCVLVNDGSRDCSRALIDAACTDPVFAAIHFSRNFGHQAAVTAGLRHATGHYIAVIDGDLQDPPELIPDMILAMRRQDADVAYGVRAKRREHPLKRSAYFLFYRLLSVLTPLEIPLDSGDFGVITQRVARVINAMPEHHRFVRGLRTYAGFRQIPFHYRRQSREAGKPKYTFRKLVNLALDGIFTFSELPLRVATLLGLVVSASSFLTGLYWLVWRLVTAQDLPGFATISVGIFFLGGVQLLCLGILGEYIGRIHNEVKSRPTYVIDASVGLTPEG